MINITKHLTRKEVISMYFSVDSKTDITNFKDGGRILYIVTVNFWNKKSNNYGKYSKESSKWYSSEYDINTESGEFLKDYDKYETIFL